MLDESTYRDKNQKLEDQLYKLRRANQELSSVFRDLDSLMDQTSVYSHHHDHSTSYIHSRSDSSSLSRSSSSEYIYEQKALVVRPPAPPPVPKKKKPKNAAPQIKYSYKGPSNYIDPDAVAPSQTSQNDEFVKSLIDNLSSSLNLPLHRQPTPSRREPDMPVRRQSVSSSVSNSTSAPKRPPWKGQNLSASHSSLNTFNRTKSAASRAPAPTTNPKFVKPWQPNNPQIKRSLSNMYLSSSNPNLHKSASFDKKNSAKKEIGPGWKSTYKSGSKTSEYDVYRDPNPKEYDPRLVTVKRKFKVDDKDVGNGWKHTVGKSRDDLRASLNKLPPSEELDTNVVKRKVLVDPKDVGGGWKPVYKGKEEKPPLSAPTGPYVDPEPPANPFKKSIEKDDKDVGGGWRATGKVNQDELFKHKPFDKSKVKAVPIAKNYKPGGEDVEEEAPVRSSLAEKPMPKRPPPAQTSKPKTKWQPVIKADLAATKHPNTWLDDALIKAEQEKKTSKTKSAVNQPNRSQNTKPASGNKSETESVKVRSRPSSSGSASRAPVAKATSTPNASYRGESEAKSAELSAEDSRSKNNQKPASLEQSLDESEIVKGSSRLPKSQERRKSDDTIDDEEEMKDIIEEKNNNESVKNNEQKSNQAQEELNSTVKAEKEPEVEKETPEQDLNENIEDEVVEPPIRMPPEPVSQPEEEINDVNDQEPVPKDEKKVEEKVPEEEPAKGRRESIFDFFKGDKTQNSQSNKTGSVAEGDEDDDDDEDDAKSKNQLWNLKDSDEE